jgi:hypothetical protein
VDFSKTFTNIEEKTHSRSDYRVKKELAIEMFQRMFAHIKNNRSTSAQQPFSHIANNGNINIETLFHEISRPPGYGAPFVHLLFNTKKFDYFNDL